jgi:hypothetical protein
MPLFSDSGQTPERRNEEATRIFEMFLPHWSVLLEDFNGSDRILMFKLHGMYRFKDRHKVFVSPKELFRLRDMKEKYL